MGSRQFGVFYSLLNVAGIMFRLEQITTSSIILAAKQGYKRIVVSKMYNLSLKYFACGLVVIIYLITFTGPNYCTI